jgi:hypothetical protein
MAQRDHIFKNVAVPEEDHRRLNMIAASEDRSMARQLAVMIREKFRELGLELDAPNAEQTTGTAADRGTKSAAS